MAYAQHFCGEYEMISKITLGQKHLSCGMVKADSGCCGEYASAKEYNCCENDYTQVTIDDATASNVVEFIFPVQFIASYLAVFQLHFPLADQALQPLYTKYDPPPLIKDIPVLYETFLI